MKAVVVELRGQQAAVLQSDGSVLLVKNRQYAVGQVLELREEKKPLGKLAARLAWAAAVAAVTVIPACAYFLPYSYVSLDVNPSVEYSLNLFDRVLSYSALNDDGAEILSGLALRNRSIGEAVELTVGALAEEGYLTSEEPTEIVITASSGSETKSGELAASLAKAAESAADEAEVDVQVESESVGKERVEQAQELGLTPGKLKLIEKLQESSPDDESVQVEDWADKSVGEIISQTKKNENASEKSNENSSGNASENSSGNANENSSSGKETAPGQAKKADDAETDQSNTGEDSEEQSESDTSNEDKEGKQTGSAQKSEHPNQGKSSSKDKEE